MDVITKHWVLLAKRICPDEKGLRLLLLTLLETLVVIYTI